MGAASRCGGGSALAPHGRGDDEYGSVRHAKRQTVLNPHPSDDTHRERARGGTRSDRRRGGGVTAGQAIHNMNLMLGLEETAGLDIVPLAP